MLVEKSASFESKSSSSTTETLRSSNRSSSSSKVGLDCDLMAACRSLTVSFCGMLTVKTKALGGLLPSTRQLSASDSLDIVVGRDWRDRRWQWKLLNDVLVPYLVLVL